MLPIGSGTGAAFRARTSRMIGTGVRNNAEHHANRIDDASGYKKGHSENTPTIAFDRE
jgi:hypothetical protein